jgi:hypothetical protein
VGVGGGVFVGGFGVGETASVAAGPHPVIIKAKKMFMKSIFSMKDVFLYICLLLIFRKKFFNINKV